MSDGCEQGQRFPAALQEGYFRPDETSFETLASMSAALASHLRFYDLALSESGTWGELFEGDEALVLARIATTDLRAAQAQFVRDADAAPLTTLASQIMALAHRIDGWLKSLRHSAHASSSRVCARIELLLEQPLGDDLQWVLDRFGTHEWNAQPLHVARRRFDAAWFGRQRLHEASAHRSDREMLRRRFFSFVSAIERIQDLARQLLPESLGHASHGAAAGLLMAFLQLYETVQRNLNRFTSRHVDFYYDDCLRMRRQAAEPDAVHLVCERSPLAAAEVVVPRGTRFGAGKDARGQLIQFEADTQLLVTDCRVAALITMRLDRDPYISPEREFGYVTRIDAARLPWPPTEAANPDGPPPHWPLFGGTPKGPIGGQAEARVGLAVASPILALASGQREIELRFGLAQSVDADSHLQHLAALATESPRAMQRRLPVLFKRYLAHAPDLLGDPDRADLNATARRLAHQAQQRLDASPPPPAAQAGPYELFLLELTASAPTRELFFRRLGKLFARWLLARQDWLTENRLQAVRETASQLLGYADRPTPGPDDEPRPAPVAGDPRCLLQGPNSPERALIFGQLVNTIFSFELTSPTGWQAIQDFSIDAVDGSGGGACTALRVVLHLRPQDPAVVASDPVLHGPDWPTDQPALRIRLRDQSRLFSYSLMEDVLLTEISIAVRVQGLRDLVMHNNLGRIDVSKPFMPFGPLPSLASYCVFGADEIARKNVTQLHVNIEWSGLPTCEGGWGTYYEAYDPALRSSSFTANLGILRDGQWRTAGVPGSLCLFEVADAAGRLSTSARWSFPEAALRAHGRATLEPLDYHLAASNGFYRVQLAAPEMAFGHAEYPALLTEVVSANARRSRRQRPLALPNPPYTPVVERLTLDYEAECHIVLGQDRQADADTQRVLHLHPFGISQVYPGAAGAGPTLWPRFAHDGNLYIGLQAEELSGALTLHFHLRDESAVESLDDGPRASPSWSYLASNQWHPFHPAQVVSDTTCGFLTSGIVTLDVPAQIDRLSTILPDTCYWLRLSVDSGFEQFAGLYGIRTQALRARRVPPQGAEMATAPLPAGSVRDPLATVVGLASVTQVGPSFGMRAAEDRRQMHTRTGERLRHRQRASTAWDYERLVLELFPSVMKVKCFAHRSARLSSRHAEVAPGEVLVVVVPSPPVAEAGATAEAEPVLSATAEPHLNAVELARIRDALRRLASPFAHIHVRNAAYERIQVRCTVKLARGVQQGQALRQINQSIVDYLSPWRPGGLRPTLDWTVRCEEVEAHIRSLPSVEFVSGLSLLHVVRSDEQLYTLSDTARSQGMASAQVRPRSPWSIALPMREHMVMAVDVPSDERPEITGIAHLGLGNTFILGEVAS